MKTSLKQLTFFSIVLFIIFFITPLYAQTSGRQRNDDVTNNPIIGKQWAVFIAIDIYQEWRPLKNPVKDAKEIRDILLEQYYIDEVIELYDQQATNAAIRDLFGDELRSKVQKDDSVFIFYAGHGYTDPLTKTGSWIPTNGGGNTSYQTNWIGNNQIRSMLKHLPAKHVFLVSDSCYSGDLMDISRGGPPPQFDNAYYSRAYSLASRQVMSSGASEEVKDSSEFALRLKNALDQAKGAYIDPEYLFTTAGVREVQSSQPMLGVISDDVHQNGGSFLFFRKQGNVSGPSLPMNVTGSPTPLPSEQKPGIVVKPQTGSAIGFGFMNLAFGLGSYLQGDIPGGVIVTGGYAAALGLIVWELNLSRDDAMSGLLGTVGIGVGAATLIFGFVKPLIYNSNRRLASAVGNFDVVLVSSEQNKKALAIKYTHSF